MQNITEVEVVNKRLNANTIMISPMQKYFSVRVFSYDDEDFQKYYIWSKANLDLKEGILLEYNFATKNHIKPGDTVKILVDEEYRSYIVSAIVSSPETLSMSLYDNINGTNSDFGYIYVSNQFLINETQKEKNNSIEEIHQKEKEVLEQEKLAQETFEDFQLQIDEAKSEYIYQENIFNLSKNKLSELSFQRNELEQVRNSLIQGEIDINNQLNELEEQKESLLNAKKQLQDSKLQLVDASNKLNDIDDSLNELDDLENLLKSNKFEQIINVIDKLPVDTSISKLYDYKDRIQGFLELLDSYNIPIDLGTTIQKASNSLDSFAQNTLNDREYFNSEDTAILLQDILDGKEGIDSTKEYEELQKIILKYNPITTFSDFEKAFSIAKDINEKISSYIESNMLFTVTSFISNLGEDKPLKELLEDLDDYRDYADKIEKYAELIDFSGSTDMTSDVVDAYYDILKVLESKKQELQELRNQIISKLAEQNISENEILDYISEINSKLLELEINEGKIGDGLSQINSTLTEISGELENCNLYLEQINFAVNQLNSSIAVGERSLKLASIEINNKQNELDAKILDTSSQIKEAKLELKRALEEIQNKKGYEDLYNQILLKFKNNSNHIQLLNNFEKELNKQEISVIDSFVYEDSGLKKRIDANLEPLKTMSIFTPIVFFSIILSVVFLFMSLMVKQSRREIGILRALGYTKNQVRFLFCIINFIVSTMACIIGYMIGYGIAKYTGNYYENFFPLPFFNFNLNYKMYAISVVLTILVGQIATIISTTHIARIKPSEAMTRENVQDTKITKSMDILTNKVSPFTKFNIITLLRNKVRLIFTIICVSATIMMIFSSLSFIASKDYILDELFPRRIHYDAQVYFSESPETEIIESIKKLNYINNLENVDYYSTTIEANGNKEQAVINAITQDTDLIEIYDTQNNLISIPKNGIILDCHIAERLKVKVGDIVKIKNSNVIVKAISEQSINHIQYISKEQAVSLGKADMQTLILNIDEGKEQEFLQYLTGKDNYLYTSFTQLAKENYEKNFSTFDLAAWIVIIFAIIIGFVIIINTELTNLLEQKKKLCLLRVLGFQHSEISRHWSIQSYIQFFISCIIGFPFGIYIAKVTLSKLSTSSRQFIFVNDISKYLLTMLIVFIYIIISHIISMSSLKKWNITEIVNEKE